MSGFDNLNEMNIINVILLLYILSSKSQSLKKIGAFWHISDVYWSTRPKHDKCLEQIITCVNKALNVLGERSGRLHPDFVLWSSAGGPHLKTVIRQMKKVIQNIVVLPSLAPINLPAANKYILYYENMSDYFGNWLDGNARQTFWKTGYYSQKLRIPEKLQVIVLNTAFFCKFHVASELDDPANQWTWLSLELIKARKAKRLVYLLLSATPGIAGTYGNRMFTAKHNRRYIAMVRTFSDVIKGQFGGYEEGNKFHIFYDKNGLFLTWLKDVIDVKGKSLGSIKTQKIFFNPLKNNSYGERGCGWLMLSPPFHDSARLYLYDTETLEPLDYIQFYITDQAWHVQHRFSSYYSVPNISVFSLELLLTRMQRNEDIFAKYISATTLSRETNSQRCGNDTCTKTSICNIRAVDYNAYVECMVLDNNRHLFGGEINNGTCIIMSSLFLFKCFFSVLFVNKLYI